MQEISYKDLKFNPFNLIGGEWMLITAGDEHSCNTMTASWGHLGCLWGNNDPSAVVYIRESRYTKEFVDEEPYFSLCVMDKSFKKQMAYLGSTSGRDEDKIRKSSPVASSIRKPSTRVIRRVTITPCTWARSRRCW